MNIANLPHLLRHFVRAKWHWTALNGASLERYQDARARQLVSYVNAHSPFYRQHWVGHDLADWRNLPIIDKQVMMNNFDAFNTRGIRREAAMEVALQAEQTRNFQPVLNGLTVGLSSGTSGHRGLFMASPQEQAGWAGTMLARALHRLPRGRLRVAFFLRSNSNLYESIGGVLIQFRYFDLMTPLDDAIAALNEFQPNIVIGPPSLLAILANSQNTGSLHIKPERLISVAEVLEPQDRTRIEEEFDAPVHQIYQCTEGLLAVSCPAGGLHIQEDVVALQLEPLADDGGERVTPIVTDLWRRTQPIIRYRLNDVLRMESKPCTCGSTFRVIRAIEGRCDDICYFEQESGGTRLFFPDTIRRMILLASPEITDYQVEQARCGHLRIHLTVATDAQFDAVTRAVQESVATTVAQYGCRLAALQIEKGSAPAELGVKRRRVIRIAS